MQGNKPSFHLGQGWACRDHWEYTIVSSFWTLPECLLGQVSIHYYFLRFLLSPNPTPKYRGRERNLVATQNITFVFFYLKINKYLMTSIIIYSLYVMPCVHLHRRGHWIFYLVLYETFEFNLSRRVILCHWQTVIQLWNELADIFCFQFGVMLFLWRKNWFIFRVSFLVLTCPIFLFGALSWVETLMSQVVTYAPMETDVQHRCVALDRKLLNPSFHWLRTWDSSNTGRENCEHFYNIS